MSSNKRRCDACGAPLEQNEKLCMSCLLSSALKGSAPELGAPSKVGGYILDTMLGVGGMGEVYLAKQPHLERKVALKLMLSEQLAGSSARQQFYNEANAVAAMEHPNVLTVYEVGEDAGFLFLSMRWIRGGSLADLLDSEKTPEFVCPKNRQSRIHLARFVSQIAEGIRHAHQRGILHLDLKPSNILIEENGQPIVADFGVARLVDNPNGKDYIAGSPAYMAPEQWKNERPSVATDIYAVGLILFELLTGTKANKEISSSLSRRGYPNKALEQRAAHLSQQHEALGAICCKCLDHNPTNRYDSSDQLIQDLEAYRNQRAVSCYKENPQKWLARLCRRSPVLAFCCFSIVALMVLTSFLAWQSIEEARKRADSQQKHLEFVREKKAQTQANLANYCLREANEKLASHHWRDALIQYQKAAKLSPSGDATCRLAQKLYSSLAKDYPTILPHSEGPCHAAVSSTGQIAVSGSSQEVIIWPPDLNPRNVIRIPVEGIVHCFDYNSDGNYLCIFSKNTLKSYSSSGQLINSILVDEPKDIDYGHQWPSGVDLIAHPSDPDRIFQCGAEIIERRLPNLETIRHFQLPKEYNGHTQKQLRFGLNQSGSILFVSDRAKHNCLVNLENEQLTHIKMLHTRCHAFSSDGTWLSMGHKDGTIILVDPSSGKISAEAKHLTTVTDLIFCEDDKENCLLISASRDRTARLWDIDKPKIEEIHTFRHPAAVTSLSYDSDSKTVYTNCEDHLIRAFGIDRRQEHSVWPGSNHHLVRVRKFKEHLLVDSTLGGIQINEINHQFRILEHVSLPCQISEIIHKEDQVYLLSTYPSIKFGKLKLGGNSFDNFTKEEGEPTSFWSKCSDRNSGDFAIGLKNGSVLILQDNKVKKLFPISDQAIEKVDINRKHNLVIASDVYGFVYIYDYEGNMLLEPIEGSSVFAVAISPNGKLAAISRAPSQLILIELGTGNTLKKVNHSGHTNRLLTLEFSNDGRYLLSGGMDKTARIWKSDSLEQIGQTMRHSDYVWTAAFSPDGQSVITGGQENQFRIWDTQTGFQIGAPRPLHSWPNAIRFVDNNSIAIVYSDHTFDYMKLAINKRDFLTEFSILTGTRPDESKKIDHLDFDRWLSEQK